MAISMKTTLACVLSVAVVLVAASILAGQDRPGDRPGTIWPAKVWVQNRDRTEAVPVSIPDIATVEVIGMPAVTITPSTIVQSRLVRQTWEYSVVTVPRGGDPVATLSRSGLDGWEATGVQFPSVDGTSLLMKRPRQ
jgi:hypothetical protein